MKTISKMSFITFSILICSLMILLSSCQDFVKKELLSKIEGMEATISNLSTDVVKLNKANQDILFYYASHRETEDCNFEVLKPFVTTPARIDRIRMAEYQGRYSGVHPNGIKYLDLSNTVTTAMIQEVIDHPGSGINGFRINFTLDAENNPTVILQNLDEDGSIITSFETMRAVVDAFGPPRPCPELCDNITEPCD